MKRLSLTALLVFSLILSGCTAGNGASQTDQTSPVVSEPQNTVTNATNPEENNSSEGDKASEKILVYISGPEAMITKLEEGFEAKRGDVADFLVLSCGEVRSKVWTEKEAGEIQADVVLGSDPLIYNKLDDEGLLDDLSTVENTEFIGEEFVSGHSYLYFNERYITIIYNSAAISEAEAPTSFDDLLSDQYNGRLVMADAALSSTSLGIISSLYQLKDITYFEGLHANGLLLAKSNGQVPSLILEGQYDLGIAPHDSVVRLQNQAKKEGYEISLQNIWPEEGAIAIRRPVGIIKDENRSEQEQKIAEELVNYLLSKEAQMITTNFGFVSVRNDIENSYLPEGVEKINIDWETASEYEDTLKELYEQIFQS